jgi:hypothetical protein
MDWGIVILLLISVPFAVWGFWVFDKGETRSSRHSGDRRSH